MERIRRPGRLRTPDSFPILSPAIARNEAERGRTLQSGKCVVNRRRPPPERFGFRNLPDSMRWHLEAPASICYSEIDRLFRELKENKFMPVKIKKILYATDLSATSPTAYLYAVKLAKALEAKIVILYVFEELPQTQSVPRYFRDVVDQHYETFKTEGHQEIRDRLERLCVTEFKDDPECADMVEAIEVVMGYPFSEILAKADQYDCDMIVIGSHGKGALNHTMLGSVAQRLLRSTRKPVLVVPI